MLSHNPQDTVLTLHLESKRTVILTILNMKKGQKSPSHQKRSLKKEKVKTDKMKQSGNLKHFATEIKNNHDERELMARNHKFILDCKSI